MVYCAGKLIENLKLFYKSNRSHFLWLYRRDNPLGCWENTRKDCKSPSVTYQISYSVFANRFHVVHFVVKHLISERRYLKTDSIQFLFRFLF